MSNRSDSLILELTISTLLTVTFVILKLLKCITLSWWWVLSPAIITTIIIIITMITVIILEK